MMKEKQYTHVTRRYCSLLACLILFGTTAGSLHAAVLAQYNFAYDANQRSGDPAGPPNEISNTSTPFYLFDSDNAVNGSGNPLDIDGNSNILAGPPVSDLSGNSRDLLNPGLAGVGSNSSSSHPRFITSTANGGSGAQGLVVKSSPLNPRTADTFAVSEYNQGFTLDITIEVERTSIGSLELFLVALPGLTLAINDATPLNGSTPGGVVATIRNTFGAGSAIASTSSVLRTVSGDRPVSEIRLLYAPNNPDNTLFLFINNVLEAKGDFTFASPGSTTGILGILGGPTGSRSLTDVIIRDFRLVDTIPEPTSVGVFLLGSILAMLKRRTV